MYVEVLVELKNKNTDKTFTYSVPEKLRDLAQVGKRVLVPFGKQTLEGYILNLVFETELQTKDILDVIDMEPVLNEEMLSLGTYFKELSLQPLSSCYAAMLPKALKASKKTNVAKKMETKLCLKVDYDVAVTLVKTESQRKLLSQMKTTNEMLKKDANLISASSVKTLLKKGILEETEEEVYRSILTPKIPRIRKVLTAEQQVAYEKIKEGFHTTQVYLLHGVTGSGKTEIYIKLLEDVLKMGKTGLVLVPEISLTPQLVSRFQEVFDSSIAVLHSRLSDGERYDEWRKILRKEVKIVIGARSAIFAPLENLGIILLDEEHSESYKQENNPHYHVLDIAKKRSEIHKCPILLGSATPSLNSMARAFKKVYTYVPLEKRANQKKMPIVKLIDMEEEVKQRHPILSRELECKIIEKLNRKEQVLLLLNRRGHSTTITCSNCGFTYRCPYCNITLTYHKTSNHLRCHYCGYTILKEDVCPNCHEDGLNFYGLGTEKLEDYIEEVFPTAKVVRMDHDSTTKKGVYEKIIEDFAKQKYDILLGTQMISKGLDFPKVSLVGILNADQSLNIPDYRSNERTFSLLTQACGRAGRSDILGEVIIQTFYKDNFILKCVQEGNYKKFFQYEMNIRKTLKYPPFYFLCKLTIKSKRYEKAFQEAQKCKSFLEQKIEKTSLLLGPTTANQFLINNVYHFEILIKYRFDSKLKNALRELEQFLNLNKEVWLDIDFE